MWLPGMAQDLYPVLRAAHLGAVTFSLSLFLARGLGVLWQAAWPMQVVWRRLSVAIDVILLLAGIGLAMTLRVHPGEAHWLGMKLLLLPVYVVLGSYALKRGRTRRHRAGFLAAALLVAALIVFFARSRGVF